MKKLFTEIAYTFLQRENGLKKRKYLAKNAGMLFEFPYENYVSFWMQDTYIPLDIAFINSSGEIFQIENMYPLSTRSVSSGKKCKYALEVNRNWFKDNDIGKGCIIRNIADLRKSRPIHIAQIEGQNGNSVVLDKSYESIFAEADKQQQDLVILYETQDGKILPPKVISPPFIFVNDKNGKKNAIINAWDAQEGGPRKNFLINHIIDIQKKEGNNIDFVEQDINKENL